MTTTFHVTNFKNKTLNMLSGTDTGATPIGFVGFFNGAQPADPSVAPTGAGEFAAIGSGPNLSARLGAAGGGVTQLATPTGPTTPANALGVASLTFARVYTTGQVPIIDTPCTLAGGGGGVIIDSLTSVAGVGNIVQAFGFKMPTSVGTISLSQSLADRLADLWGGGNTTVISMGNITNGSSTLSIYSGGAPASADAPVTGTLLAQYNMSGTNLWAAAAGGSMALAAAGPSVLAVGTGTAGYFRFVKNNGLFTFTIQGTVGTAAADCIVNTTAITSGVTTVQVTDITVSI